MEGDDDEEFFNEVLKVYLKKKYSFIKFYQYAQITNGKVRDFIESILSMEADLIYIADINNHPCITKKKRL